MNSVFCKFIPKHWVSRAKTLLKRRKKAIKSRPISAKKLEQQQKLFSYSKQYRALQIQKQLDKRTYSSQHINQLMDHIFYPDVTQAHQQAAKIYMETSALKHYDISNFSKDKYDQQINQIVLATQLIQYYLQNKDELQIDHLITLCQKFRYYFTNRDKIKARLERKWAKMNQNMKKKDKNYKDKKCPYLFIDKEDTFHFVPWNQMIDSFVQKITGKASEFQHVAQTVLQLSQIIQIIYKSIGYIPLKVYQLFERTLLNIPQQQFSALQLLQYHSLIKIISLKSLVRYPAHVIIQTLDQQRLNKFNERKQQILKKLLSDPQITGMQLGDIIKCLQYSLVQLSQTIDNQLKVAVLANLVQLPFQKVVDLLDVYITTTLGEDAQFVQLIKFDILRKASNAISKKHLFKCMHFVKQKYITFNMGSSSSEAKNKNKIYAHDLFIECANTLCSKYCGINSFTYQQTIQFISLLFTNGLNDINLLQLLANQIVKLKQQVGLVQLTSTLFKLNILGYQSPILARILYEQYDRKYRDLKKQLQEQQVKLIEGQTNKNVVPAYRQKSNISPQQLILEQNLIISLWMLFSTNKNQAKAPVSVDNLMKIYPLASNSKHPLIYEMCLSLNQQTKKLGILWPIKQVSYLKKSRNAYENKLDQYYQQQKYSLPIKALQQQANQTDIFIANYNTKTNQFIPYKWSSSNTYSIQNYFTFISNPTNMNKNYFIPSNPISKNLLQLRNKLITEYPNILSKQKKQDQNQKQPKQDQFYQID